MQVLRKSCVFSEHPIRHCKTQSVFDISDDREPAAANFPPVFYWACLSSRPKHPTWGHKACQHPGKSFHPYWLKFVLALKYPNVVLYSGQI